MHHLLLIELTTTNWEMILIKKCKNLVIVFNAFLRITDRPIHAYLVFICRSSKFSPLEKLQEGIHNIRIELASGPALDNFKDLKRLHLRAVGPSR